MKAIVSVTSGSQGTLVVLYGYGQTEQEARIEAAHYLAGGYCPRADFEDQGFQGGILVEVDESLENLLEAKGWDDTYDQDGNLVGSSANDNHLQALEALTNLRVEKGILKCNK